MIMNLSLHILSYQKIDLFIHMIMKNTGLIWFINITVIIIIVQQMSWTCSSQGRWRQRRRKFDALCLADNLIHYRDSVQFPPLRIVDDTIGINRLSLSTAQTNIKKLLFGREDRLTPAQKLLRISEYLDLETKK